MLDYFQNRAGGQPLFGNTKNIHPIWWVYATLRMEVGGQTALSIVQMILQKKNPPFKECNFDNSLAACSNETTTTEVFSKRADEDDQAFLLFAERETCRHLLDQPRLGHFAISVTQIGGDDENGQKSESQENVITLQHM